MERSGTLVPRLGKECPAGASGGAAYRVTDFLDRTEAVLVELKFMDACNFTITSQIRDFATWANQNGYRMVLVTPTRVKYSSGMASGFL